MVYPGLGSWPCPTGYRLFSGALPLHPVLQPGQAPPADPVLQQALRLPVLKVHSHPLTGEALAGKVTGMILEMTTAEILALLNNPEALKAQKQDLEVQLAQTRVNVDGVVICTG